MMRVIMQHFITLITFNIMCSLFDHYLLNFLYDKFGWVQH